jgi:hypothetical protein
MLEQFENISGAEKLGPVSSMMLISLWRKAEKMNNRNVFSISDRELMILSGIKKATDFLQALNRLVHFGFIRYESDRENGLKIELNLNLYEPFERQSDKDKQFTDVMDALEQTYIRLRGAGHFISPIEFQEIRKVAESGIKPLDAVRLLEECFNEYTPKYNGDSIRSFKYCANYILARYSQEQAKKGVFKNEKYQSNSSTIRPKQPEIPREIREYREELKAKGLLNRKLGNLDFDF